MTLREDFLTVLFRYFDVDSNNIITDIDIIEAFHKNGKELDIYEAKKIIKTNPTSKGLGGFNFPYFQSLMLSTQDQAVAAAPVDLAEEDHDIESNVLVEIVSVMNFIIIMFSTMKSWWTISPSLIFILILMKITNLPNIQNNLF